MHFSAKVKIIRLSTNMVGLYKIGDEVDVLDFGMFYRSVCGLIPRENCVIVEEYSNG